MFQVSGLRFAIAQSSGDVMNIVLAAAGMIAALLIGLVVIMAIRKRTRRDEETGGPGNFTLAELRDLHSRGELSDEQYEAALSAIIGSVRVESNEIAEARRAREQQRKQQHEESDS